MNNGWMKFDCGCRLPWKEKRMPEPLLVCHFHKEPGTYIPEPEPEAPKPRERK